MRGKDCSMRSRRKFLQTSLSLGAGALALGPLSALGETAAPIPAPIAGSKMRWGMVTYLWGADWDLSTLLANLEATKAYGVELRTTHAHGVEPSLNAAERAEIKKRFDDSPVVCLGPGSADEYDNPDPAVVRRNIESTKAFVKLSHDIGGTGVKVRPNNLHRDIPREQTIEQIGKSLNEVAGFAADYGQEIRLEVHGSGTADLTVVKAIMDVADHPKAVVCWNGNTQDLRGDGLEHNFNLVKDRFGATVHVRELTGSDYPWQELMNLFVQMDYDGWILLEASSRVEDRIAALHRQRETFEAMVANAVAAKQG